MAQRPPLRERKQQRAREAITDAAFELFAERGFGGVTVVDIAERAEVGRTTFFRYFGDKQEVVFADEQQLLDDLLDRHRVLPQADGLTLPEVLSRLRSVVMTMCDEVTRNARRYVLHETLLEQNPELHDRAARKVQRFTDALSRLLREQGASHLIAALAPQLALACYHAGRQVAGLDPAELTTAVEAAFDELESLVTSP